MGARKRARVRIRATGRYVVCELLQYGAGPARSWGYWRRSREFNKGELVTLEVFRCVDCGQLYGWPVGLHPAHDADMCRCGGRLVSTVLVRDALKPDDPAHA
jgi:hypothetical protein